MTRLRVRKQNPVTLIHVVLLSFLAITSLQLTQSSHRKIELITLVSPMHIERGRNRICMALQEESVAQTGNIIDFDPDFLNGTITVPRVNRRRIIAFPIFSFPLITRHESSNSDSTQFGFVDWSSITFPITKVVRLD